MILFKKITLFIYLCMGLMFFSNAQNNRLLLVKLFGRRVAKFKHGADKKDFLIK